MKIIRKIEDINEDCWCRLTKENFNATKKLGFGLYFETFEEYAENSAFDEDDILNICLKVNEAIWDDWTKAKGLEIKFGLETEENSEPKNSLEQFGFKNPKGYNVEILKVYENRGKKEYVGSIFFEDDIIPNKWDSEGKALLGLDFNLESIEYKQRLYTKPNNEGFLPKQKFKVSWTRDMSSALESTGWRLATNEEIENFKN